MALTQFQRRVLRVLADRRRSRGESYIAGGVALNVALDAQRLSRDFDLFHDGKDPGFSPHAILEQAARTSRYTDEEVSALAFDGPPPRAVDLARRWHEALDVARASIAALLAEHAGEAVMVPEGDLFKGGPSEIREALARERLAFHRGRLGGALPEIRTGHDAR